MTLSTSNSRGRLMASSQLVGYESTIAIRNRLVNKELGPASPRALRTTWGASSQLSAVRTCGNSTLPGQLDALYTEIETRAPNAQVIVVGYPRLFNGEECNLGARISPDEQSALNGVAAHVARAVVCCSTACTMMRRAGAA